MTFYQIVSERIQTQLLELEPLVSRALDAWHDYEIGDAKSYAIDAVALNLQRLYSGIESLLDTGVFCVTREDLRGFLTIS